MLVLTGPLTTVDRVAISPDGAFVAAAGGTMKRLVVWAIRESDQPRHVLPVGFDRRLWPFCFEPTSGLLLAGDNYGVTAHDPADGEEVWEIPTRSHWECGVAALDVSADGRELVAAFADGSRSYAEYQRWELNGKAEPVRKRVGRGPEGNLCRAVAFLPGTTSFVAAEDHPLGSRFVGPIRIVVDYQARLRLVNASGRTAHTLYTGFPSAHQLAMSADGRFVAAQFPRAIVVWDTRSLDTPPQMLRPQKRLALTGVAFHPSGQHLAAVGNESAVWLYETATWRIAKEYNWDIGRMRSVCFSRDGFLAAAGSDTGKVVVWDVDG